MRIRLAIKLLLGIVFMIGPGSLGARSIQTEDSLGISIKGNILSEAGGKLAYATIKHIQKGWTLVADENGSFSANILKDDQLLIKCSGYEDQLVQVEKAGELVIKMNAKEDAGIIEESGSRTLVKGWTESKELDSLYANDIIVNRDMQIPDTLMGFSVFPEKLVGAGMLSLGVQLIPEGSYMLSVVDGKGKECYQKMASTRAGDKIYSIDLPVLPSGEYSIILDLGKGKHLRKKIIICK